MIYDIIRNSRVKFFCSWGFSHIVSLDVGHENHPQHNNPSLLMFCEIIQSFKNFPIVACKILQQLCQRKHVFWKRFSSEVYTAKFSTLTRKFKLAELYKQLRRKAGSSYELFYPKSTLPLTRFHLNGHIHDRISSVDCWGHSVVAVGTHYYLCIIWWQIAFNCGLRHGQRRSDSSNRRKTVPNRYTSSINKHGYKLYVRSAMSLPGTGKVKILFTTKRQSD